MSNLQLYLESVHLSYKVYHLVFDASYGSKSPAYKAKRARILVRAANREYRRCATVVTEKNNYPGSNWDNALASYSGVRHG